MALRTIPLGLKYAGIGVGAIALQACASTQTANEANKVSNEEYRAAVGVYSNPAGPVGDEGMDPIASAAFWGTRYNANQSDPMVAVKFSQSLRKMGSLEEAVGVMQKASEKHPAHADVSLEYGKVLVENGRAFEAVRHLENAAKEKSNDWSALSAYGVALDQIGEHAAARKRYDQALMIAPNATSVVNNKGLSYAIEGNLSMARTTLTKAAARAGGDARIRQNLALVLALSGDMQGAERLARSDLPPQVADNNIDYFRQLMNQPAYWDEYAATNVDAPNFDKAPSAPLSPKQKPQLQEQPKPEDDKNEDGAPIALIEVAPVTNASTSSGVELKKTD